MHSACDLCARRTSAVRYIQSTSSDCGSPRQSSPDFDPRCIFVSSNESRFNRLSTIDHIVPAITFPRSNRDHVVISVHKPKVIEQNAEHVRVAAVLNSQRAHSPIFTVKVELSSAFYLVRYSPQFSVTRYPALGLSALCASFKFLPFDHFSSCILTSRPSCIVPIRPSAPTIPPKSSTSTNCNNCNTPPSSASPTIPPSGRLRGRLRSCVIRSRYR